ncbi:ATP-dependent RNA helicase DED1 [Verticillium dahliae VDG2]|nr:ATP-dependent RNA helicase DED1 [Verticillium dahliae VDG2]
MNAMIMTPHKILRTTREDGPFWAGPLLALIALATAIYILLSTFVDLALSPYSAHLSGAFFGILLYHIIAVVLIRPLSSGAGESCIREAGFPNCGRPAFCCKRATKDLSAACLANSRLKKQVAALEDQVKTLRKSAQAADAQAQAQQQRLASASLAHEAELARVRTHAKRMMAAAAKHEAARSKRAAKIKARDAAGAPAAQETVRAELAELEEMRRELVVFRPDPFARATIEALKREKGELVARNALLEATAGPLPLLDVSASQTNAPLEAPVCTELEEMRRELVMFRPDPFARATIEALKREKGELAPVCTELEEMRRELVMFRPDPFARATIEALKREKGELVARNALLEAAAGPLPLLDVSAPPMALLGASVCA